MSEIIVWFGRIHCASYLSREGESKHPRPLRLEKVPGGKGGKPTSRTSTVNPDESEDEWKKMRDLQYVYNEDFSVYSHMTYAAFVYYKHNIMQFSLTCRIGYIHSK